MGRTFQINYGNDMKVLELFAGSRSFSKVCEDVGWDTYTTDMESFSKIDQICDIFEFDYDKCPFEPDIIWASPPCTTFSVASISTHWTGGHRAYIPKTERAKLGLKILDKTIELIKLIKPKYWYIENPRGVMRKVDPMVELTPYRKTIWYCQYGDDRAKPTDIWTNNPLWKPRPVCKNGNRDCHHQPAPRGSKTGTQGLKGSYERSKVPEDLCKEIIETHL